MERIENTKIELKKLDTVVQNHLDLLKNTKENFLNPKSQFLKDLKNKRPQERREYFEDVISKISVYKSDAYTRAESADYNDMGLALNQIRDLKLNLTLEKLLDKDTHGAILDYITLVKEHFLEQKDYINNITKSIGSVMLELKQKESNLDLVGDLLSLFFDEKRIYEEKVKVKEAYEKLKILAKKSFQNLQINETGAKVVVILNKQLMDLLEIGERLQKGEGDAKSLKKEFERVKKSK